TIRSTLGVGTSVELFLSRMAADRSDLSHDEGGVTPDAAKIRILLVDDDAEVRTVTAAYLNEMGHRGVEAADGTGALELLKADNRFALLIAGFAMPGMTGLELAGRSRKLQPDVGVLLITGYADPERVPDNHPVLHKPFSRAELGRK